MPWMQNYDPASNQALSTAVCLLPILLLFWGLAVRRMKSYLAALLALTAALLMALLFQEMPLPQVAAAVFYGFFYGMFPIGWLIFTAVFLFNLVVEMGQFKIIQESIKTLTSDHRLMVLLVGFAFNGFLEGGSGFGAPVAICSAMLVGMGINPLLAAGLCLVANTTPVIFGGIGNPIIVSSQISGTDLMEISRITGRELSLMSFIIPFWLLAVMDGWKGVRELWLPAALSGGAFAGAMYYTATSLGPFLPAVLSPLAAALALIIYIYTKKKTATALSNSPTEFSRLQMGRAWLPYLSLILLVLLWSVPAVKNLLNQFTLLLPMPMLHHEIVKVFPVVAASSSMEAVYRLNWLSIPGTAIFLAAIISSLLFKVRAADFTAVVGNTLKQLGPSLAMIILLLGFANLYTYSGASSTLALAFTSAGRYFPLFSPALGWLGVFLTGSVTSSNALITYLQRVAAEQAGFDPVFLVAANGVGGVAGKMISPQSIAIAAGAVGMVGREGELFRFTIKHSLLFLLAVTVINWLLL